MKTHRFIQSLLFVFLVIFGLSATGHAVIVDRIIAIVNDTIITQSDLNNALAPVRKKLKQIRPAWNVKMPCAKRRTLISTR